MSPVALQQIREYAPVILPSLLLCDFGNLEREVRQLEQAGVHALHLDVMDGRFVSNLTYGMPIVAALRELTDLPLDVHLMIEEPTRYLSAFREAGADVITVHVEAVEEPAAALRQIHDLGAAAGLALNPATPLEPVLDVVELCDLVLVMGVPAGFGGQPFDRAALDKLTRLRDASSELVLEVDGGVNGETIRECSQAGAELFVVGSAIFRCEAYEPAVRQLEQAATS